MSTFADVVDADAPRLEELAATGVLEDGDRQDLTALADFAARMTGSPMAAVNLITDTEQIQAAASGVEPGVCSREDSMCAAVLQSEPVVVVDARRDPRFVDNPFVTGRLGRVRFYATVPLRTRRGIVIGRLCVFDERPRDLNDRQLALLTTLAERVVDALELRRTVRELRATVVDLTETRIELAASNDRLGLFAGQVSHDLLSPLAAILINVEQAMREPGAEDESIAHLLDNALSAGRRMVAMVEEALGYAQAGGRVRKADVDLDHMVDDLRHDLGALLAERRVTLVVEPLPTVLADPGLLYPVLLNLVSNAVRHNPDHAAPHVAISAQAARDGWRVAIVDNGPGIPPHQRDRVFELFARGEGSGSGSGIGLATCRRIIEAHGGEMGLEPASGGGTRAWFELPGRPSPV